MVTTQTKVMKVLKVETKLMMNLFRLVAVVLVLEVQGEIVILLTLMQLTLTPVSKAMLLVLRTPLLVTTQTKVMKVLKVETKLMMNLFRLVAVVLVLEVQAEIVHLLTLMQLTSTLVSKAMQLERKTPLLVTTQMTVMMMNLLKLNLLRLKAKTNLRKSLFRLVAVVLVLEVQGEIVILLTMMQLTSTPVSKAMQLERKTPLLVTELKVLM